MAETLKQRLTKKELDEGVIPQNQVLVEMLYSSEGLKSKGGLLVGFLPDTEWDDETTSHKADIAEIWARVYRLPERLYFKKDDPASMPWDCDMELQEDDCVWFNTIESYNAIEIECEDKHFRLIPYQDIYCAKREVYVDKWAYPKPTKKTVVVMLNGYVLCKPVYIQTSHELAIDDKKEDKTRGIVAFVGNPNRQYQNDDYVDFVDLRVGDEVVFNPNSPVFRLERQSYLAQFDGDNLYNVIQRRRIGFVAKRG